MSPYSQLILASPKRLPNMLLIFATNHPKLLQIMLTVHCWSVGKVCRHTQSDSQGAAAACWPLLACCCPGDLPDDGLQAD